MDDYDLWQLEQDAQNQYEVEDELLREIDDYRDEPSTIVAEPDEPKKKLNFDSIELGSSVAPAVAGASPTRVPPKAQRRLLADDDDLSDHDKRDAKRQKPTILGDSPVREHAQAATQVSALVVPPLVVRKEPQIYCYRQPPMGVSTLSFSSPFSTDDAYIMHRFHLKLRPERKDEAVVPQSMLSMNADGGLLPTSMGALMAKVDEMRMQKALRESQANAEKTDDNLNAAHTTTRTKTPEQQLWVDKYAPKIFTELLSEEQVNRRVLRWLKSWDACVFGKDNNTQRGTQANQKSGQQGGSFAKSTLSPFNSVTSHDNKNDDNRPFKKLILISGPPGIGKTTLAHVLARHAGYRAVEINASDERSADVLRSRVRDAAEMQPVFGSKRPNCIILDEIDGAMGGSEGKSAISALLKLIQSDSKAKAKTDKADSAPGSDRNNDDDDAEEPANEESTQTGTSSTSKTKGHVFRLARPIICICNDLYAPALRPLRDVAEVFTLQKTTTHRLSQRLKEVCTAEGLQVDMRALSALSEIADCDIRSCLNTLQFLANSKGKRSRISIDMITDAESAVGHKEVTKNTFDIWNQIFYSTRKASQARAQPNQPTQAKRASANMLYDTVNAYGEHGRIINGLYENLLEIRYTDPTLEKTALVLDYIEYTDILSQQVFRHQHFDLNRYMALPAVAVHLNCSSMERHRFKYPKLDYELKQKQSQSDNIIRSLRSHAQAVIYRAWSPRTVAVDLVSFLLDITAPTIRAVNIRLLNEREASDLRTVVSIFASFNMRFVQRRNQESGMFEYMLDPALETLVTFEHLHYLDHHKDIGQKMKQIIGHEIELETLRKNDKSKMNDHSDSTSEPSTISNTNTTESALNHDAMNIDPSVPPSAAQVKTETKSQWRNRAVEAVEQMKQSRKRERGGGAAAEENHTKHATVSAANGELQNGIVFKFFEGFTNAVRRTVHVRDLL